MSKIYLNDLMKDESGLMLNDWFYANRICEDNVEIENQNFIANGRIKMLQSISALFWTAWRKEFKFPATWFDAFKIEFFPMWLLQKYPARVIKYSFAEVIPMLSKETKYIEKQLKNKPLWAYESVSRKPIIDYEKFPLI